MQQEPSQIPAIGRIIGLDVGEARTGVAASDPMQSIATPRATVPGDGDEALQAITADLSETEAVGVVAGLPLNLKGEVGPQAEKVLAFVERLRAAVDVPVVLQDERLSTAMSERAQRETGAKRKKRKQTIDQLAAANILQTWLDRRAAERRRESG